MTAGGPALRHDDLVRELKRLRERGLGSARKLGLVSLLEATKQAGLATSDDQTPSAVEDLVRKSVKYFDGGNYEEAAAYTFGLIGGTKLAISAERRRLAAKVFGIEPDSFRKTHEKVIVDHVAEGVLALCQQHSMRLTHLQMEQRHPADSRLAVAWVERFEAYYRVWTPVYALKADLEAALATYRMEPSDQLPWDPDSAVPFDPVKEAQGYARSALYWYTRFLLAVKRFVDERGGLWLFSSPQVEEAVTDAVYRIGWHNPINEENDSWLRRKLADSRHQEAEHFYRGLASTSTGDAVHAMWQNYVLEGHKEEVAGVGELSQVQCTVVACDEFRKAVDEDWMRIADWYAPGAGPPKGIDGSDLYRLRLDSVLHES